MLYAGRVPKKWQTSREVFAAAAVDLHNDNDDTRSRVISTTYYYYKITMTNIINYINI